MAKQSGGNGFSFSGSGKPAAETEGMQVGQDKDVHISVTGEAKLSQDAIEVVDGPGFKEKADALAFNEEVVTVVVHTTDDENAENPIEVGVNGRKQFFMRGVEQKVRRKYVEVLARAKVTKYAQNIKASDPQEFNRMRPTTALRYPFSLIHDPNTAKGGQAWLSKILAEG